MCLALTTSSATLVTYAGTSSSFSMSFIPWVRIATQLIFLLDNNVDTYFSLVWSERICQWNSQHASFVLIISGLIVFLFVLWYSHLIKLKVSSPNAWLVSFCVKKMNSEASFWLLFDTMTSCQRTQRLYWHNKLEERNTFTISVHSSSFWFSPPLIPVNYSSPKGLRESRWIARSISDRFAQIF